MAKNFNFRESTTTSLNVKGILSDDCKTITVESNDGDFEVNIAEYLKEFAGDLIALSVKNTFEKDLNE